jgi:hypothetical protein
MNQGKIVAIPLEVGCTIAMNGVLREVSGLPWSY